MTNKEDDDDDDDDDLAVDVSLLCFDTSSTTLHVYFFPNQ